MTPQEKVILKAKFIQAAMKYGATLKIAEAAYKNFIKNYEVEY